MHPGKTQFSILPNGCGNEANTVVLRPGKGGTAKTIPVTVCGRVIPYECSGNGQMLEQRPEQVLEGQNDSRVSMKCMHRESGSLWLSVTKSQMNWWVMFAVCKWSELHVGGIQFHNQHGCVFVRTMETMLNRFQTAACPKRTSATSRLVHPGPDMVAGIKAIFIANVIIKLSLWKIAQEKNSMMVQIVDSQIR